MTRWDPRNAKLHRNVSKVSYKNKWKPTFILPSASGIQNQPQKKTRKKKRKKGEKHTLASLALFTSYSLMYVKIPHNLLTVQSSISISSFPSNQNCPGKFPVSGLRSPINSNILTCLQSVLNFRFIDLKNPRFRTRWIPFRFPALRFGVSLSDLDWKGIEGEE